MNPVHTSRVSPGPERFAWLTFLVYIVMLILLPSGTIYGIPIKIVVFLPLVWLTFGRIVQRNDGVWQIAFFCLVGGVLALWTALSLSQPFFGEYSLSQCKDIATTLLGCLIIRIFADTTEKQIRLVKLCVLTVAFGSLLKVGMLTYALAKGQSVSDYVDRIGLVFGVKLMSVELEEAGGRLLFPSDNLIPVCLFAILTLRKKMGIGALVAVGIFVSLLVSALYTFSRYIWLSTVLAALLGFIAGRKDKLNLSYVLAAAGLTVAALPILTTIVTLRFSSALSGASDVERVWQLSALRGFFASAPLLGHGLGSYVMQLKRSHDLPYSYEDQVLALLGQLGIIGVGLLFFLLFNFYKKAWRFRPGSRLVQVALLLLLGDLLAAGLFNPSLIVSMAAAAYGLLFVMMKLASSASLPCEACVPLS